MAAALLAQERQRRLRHPQRAEQVGLDLIASLGLAELLDHPELAVAGVVDDDVEAAEVLVRAAHRGERRVAVGHVERHGQHRVAVLRAEVVERAGVSRRRGDPVAALAAPRSPTRARTRATFQ